MKKAILFSVLVIGFLIYFDGSSFGSDRLNLNLDICQFRFNQDTSLVEVYYGLVYQTDSLDQGTISAPSFVLSLSISKNNKNIINNLWKMEGQSSGNQKNQQVMVDMMRYLLAPGTYDFKIVARHLSHTEIIDSSEVKNVTIRAIKPDKFEMSDIELAQEITVERPDNRDKFYKNRFRVLPNPLNIYDIENNQVYYYLELYNLANIKTAYYFIKRTVVDNNGLPLSSLPIYNKKKRIRGNDAVEVGMFDISQLPGGKYFLNFAILDSAKKVHKLSQTAFYVYNPAVTLADRAALSIEQQMAGSEIALLSSDDVEILIAVTNYMTTDEEKRVVNNLITENARRLFLYRYWRDIDSDNNTPALESLREVMTRVQYANENFKQVKMPGWKTDRGRVLILYGKPSLIQYYTNVPAFKEFQAWSYDHIENGVVFIFGVIGSFGDLELIHSTKTGEKYNEGWFDLIKVTSGTTGMVTDYDARTNRGQTLREIFRMHNLELPRYLK